MEDDTLLSSFLSPDKTSLLISLTDLLNEVIIRPMLSHPRIDREISRSKTTVSFVVFCGT